MSAICGQKEQQVDDRPTTPEQLRVSMPVERDELVDSLENEQEKRGDQEVGGLEKERDFLQVNCKHCHGMEMETKE